MINNSFLYQYTEGDLRGCELVRQTLLYILGHWLNGGGGLLYQVPYISVLLTFS